MGNLPTADELKGQLLKVIDEATFNKTLADLQMQTPIYKTKTGIMAAYSMIAKLHNVKLDFGLKSMSSIDPSEIMPEGQWVSINQIATTPYKVVNIQGWITTVGELGKTAKGDKDRITFDIADNTGNMTIWIFEEKAVDFNKMLDYKPGKAISLTKLTIKDDKGIKKYISLGKNTILQVCKNPPCELSMVNMGALANVKNGYVTVKAMIISDIEEVEKYGCRQFHYLDGEVGSVVPCEYCNKTPQEIIAYKAARVVIADETAQFPMEVSGSDWNSVNKPSFPVGDAFIIRAKFSDSSKLFYHYSSFPIGKYVANSIIMTSSSSTTVPSNSVIVHTETPEMRVWFAVKQKKYAYQDSDAPTIKTLLDAGVISDPKGDNHYITFFQNWTEIEAVLTPTAPSEVKVEKPSPTIELFLGNEDTLADPPADLVTGFIQRYVKVHARVYPSLTKELLYECIGKNADQNYRAKLFVSALIADNKAELVWQKDVIVLNAK